MPTPGASEPPAGTERAHVTTAMGTPRVFLRQVSWTKSDEVNSLDPKDGIRLRAAPEADLVAGTERSDDPRKDLRRFERCAVNPVAGIHLQGEQYVPAGSRDRWFHEPTFESACGVGEWRHRPRVPHVVARTLVSPE
jgi:hypothetical protein